MDLLLEHLKRRVNAPSNGLFFGELYDTKEFSIKPTKLVFDIVVGGRKATVVFGEGQRLYYAVSSEHSSLAQLVGYGWELVGMGADLVVVHGWWGSWSCGIKKTLTLDDLRKALYYVSERVSLTGSSSRRLEQITVYAIGTGFDKAQLDYALPDRKSSRNAYLANLGRYVSLLLNAPVQFDSKHVYGIGKVSFET